MTRNAMALACASLLLALSGCGDEDEGKDTGAADGGAGTSGGAAGTVGLIDGKTPDELKNGAQDPQSLLDRYEPSCPSGGVTLRGTLDGMAISESYSASSSSSGLATSRVRTREFRGGSSRAELLGVAMDAQVEYWTRYASEGHVLLPFDGDVPTGIVCAGTGSSYQTTPIEEVFELQHASYHGCPGEPTSGSLDACVVFGLDETLCANEGLYGTFDGKTIDYSVISSLGVGGVQTIEFAINHVLRIATDDAGAITKGLLKTDDGVYCVGEGSKVTVTEMDFDTKHEIELRNLSKLPSCDGARDGDDKLTVCFRP